MSRIRAILFDLDGTLIDSAPDLRTSLNRVLAADGLGPLTVEAVRDMIGNGVRKLVERGYAAHHRVLTDMELDSRETMMLAEYHAYLTIDTYRYPGVDAALEHAREHDIALAVVTNKPLAATHAILAHFGIMEQFGAIIGGDGPLPRKPAPEPLWAALEQLGVLPADSVMVGDSIADVSAARAAGVPIVLVEGGYSMVPVSELGADLVIGSLAELGAVLNQWH